MASDGTSTNSVSNNKPKAGEGGPPQEQNQHRDDNDGDGLKTKKEALQQPSARSFAGQSKAKLHHTESIQITDALSDVRVKYHVNSKELGHGHYGVVRKCMNRETKQWYAIKSIRKAKVKKIEVLKREIEILREVKHPNIIELVDVFEDAKYLHLVTELCTGGELFDRIIAKSSSPEGHYSEHDAASIIKDILDAIAYCHSKEIVHRDLKPEVSNNNIRSIIAVVDAIRYAAFVKVPLSCQDKHTVISVIPKLRLRLPRVLFLLFFSPNEILSNIKLAITICAR